MSYWKCDDDSSNLPYVQILLKKGTVLQVLSIYIHPYTNANFILKDGFLEDTSALHVIQTLKESYIISKVEFTGSNHDITKKKQGV